MVSKHDYPTHHLSSIFYLYPYWHLSNKRRTHLKMTITYSLWDGAQLLGAGFTANSADEMNKVVADLQKVSKNVVAHMRKVEQN